MLLQARGGMVTEAAINQVDTLNNSCMWILRSILNLNLLLNYRSNSQSEAKEFCVHPLRKQRDSDIYKIKISSRVAALNSIVPTVDINIERSGSSV